MSSSLPVAANKTPTGLKFNLDKVSDLRANGFFLRVNTEGKIPSKRRISGALKSWQSPKEADTVFVEQYRLTGTAQAVYEALVYAGVDERLAKDLVERESISSCNYQTSDVFARESQSKNVARVRVVQTSGISSQDLSRLADLIRHKKDEVVVSNAKESGSTKPKRGSKSASTSRRSKTLKEKYDNLKDGQVLDVSGIDTSTGDGASAIKTPKEGGRSTKVWSGDVRVVSNNLEKYVAALEMIFGDAARFSAEVADVRQKLHTRASPAKKTKKSPKKSPKKASRPASPAKSHSPVRSRSPSRLTARPVMPGSTLAPPQQIRSLDNLARSPPASRGANFASLPTFR